MTRGARKPGEQIVCARVCTFVCVCTYRSMHVCTCVSRGCSGDEEGFNKHFPITSHRQGHLWGSGGCTGGCGVQALFSRA